MAYYVLMKPKAEQYVFGHFKQVTVSVFKAVTSTLETMLEIRFCFRWEMCRPSTGTGITAGNPDWEVRAQTEVRQTLPYITSGWVWGDSCVECE